MNTSSVGSAIDDLVAIGLTAFPQSSGVVVCDGPWLDASNTPPQLIAIGISSLTGDGVTASGTSEPHAISQPNTTMERYTLSSLVFFQTGADDQKLVRDQAEAALAVYEVALRTNQNLPQDSVLKGGAYLESLQYVQVDETIPGRFCRIHFDIHVDNVLNL